MKSSAMLQAPRCSSSGADHSSAPGPGRHASPPSAARASALGHRLSGVGQAPIQRSGRDSDFELDSEDEDHAELVRLENEALRNKNNKQSQIPRPPFYADTREKVRKQQNFRKTKSTKKIGGVKPSYEMDNPHGDKIYLDKRKRVMRDDKPPSKWRQGDLDHELQFIAIHNTMKERRDKGDFRSMSPPTVNAIYRDAVSNEENLTLLDRNTHKKFGHRRTTNTTTSSDNKKAKLLIDKSILRYKRGDLDRERDRLRSQKKPAKWQLSHIGKREKEESKSDSDSELGSDSGSESASSTKHRRKKTRRRSYSRSYSRSRTRSRTRSRSRSTRNRGRGRNRRRRDSRSRSRSRSR